MPAHQLILGSVCDAFLKIPLPNARVSLLTADSIIVQDSIKVTLNKKDRERYGTAMFSLQVPNQANTYLLRATLAGYEDAWQILKVEGGIDYAWGLETPLGLRRIFEKTLDEVAVTATSFLTIKGNKNNSCIAQPMVNATASPRIPKRRLSKRK